MAEKLTAYCIQTKQKEEMLKAEVHKTKRGGFMCKGVDKDGHKMCLIVGKDKAEELIKLGIAKKAY